LISEQVARTTVTVAVTPAGGAATVAVG